MRGPETPRPAIAADVAHAARVSQSTVSLVLNGKWRGRIGEETARRVIASANELGYRLDRAARASGAARTGGTGAVLMVVPALDDPACSAVHAGAARAGAERGIGVVVFPLTDGRGRSPFQAPKRAIDGVLACSVSADDVAELRAGVPLVVLDDTPARGVPSVGMDVGGGMARALAHLTALGHRHIMHVRADRPAATFLERAQVFDRCTISHPDVTAVETACPLDPRAVRDHMTEILASHGRPTAFVCDDDTMAMGLYQAAGALGLTIGADLSVVGFGDLPLASLLSPPLTTVRLPLGELGFHGLRMLVEAGDGRTVGSVVFGTELVVRASTGPVPAFAPSR